jgi:hypothetical protein
VFAVRGEVQMAPQGGGRGHGIGVVPFCPQKLDAKRAAGRGHELVGQIFPSPRRRLILKPTDSLVERH